MTTLSPCVYIFDMNSFFARCYSALTREGEPTTTFESVPTFALIPTLKLMLKEFHAMHSDQGIVYTHIVLVFDDPGKNFRHDLDPGYKANRPPKPDSWIAQEAVMYDFFKQIGFPCLRIPGVEADDVIGTLTKKLKTKGIFSLVFSGDKDILSLCDYYVYVYQGRENKLMYDDAVVAKFGIPCDRLLDYLTIVGDNADGVKGIPGLGDNAAVTILNEMDLTTLLSDPSALIRMKIRNAKNISQWIDENRDKVEILRQLIQLKLDVPLQTNLKDFRMQPSQVQQDWVGRFITHHKISPSLPPPYGTV